MHLLIFVSGWRGWIKEWVGLQTNFSDRVSAGPVGCLNSIWVRLLSSQPAAWRIPLLMSSHRASSNKTYTWRTSCCCSLKPQHFAHRDCMYKLWPHLKVWPCLIEVFTSIITHFNALIRKLPTAVQTGRGFSFFFQFSSFHLVLIKTGSERNTETKRFFSQSNFYLTQS